MARPSRYSPEVRERAARLVREHGSEHPSQWAARSVAEKLGCRDETLRRWVRQAERDAGELSGLTHPIRSPRFPVRFSRALTAMWDQLRGLRQLNSLSGR